MWSSVLLPGPGRAHDGQRLAGVERQVDAGQDGQRAGPRRVFLVEVLDRQAHVRPSVSLAGKKAEHADPVEGVFHVAPGVPQPAAEPAVRALQATRVRANAARSRRSRPPDVGQRPAAR